MDRSRSIAFCMERRTAGAVWYCIMCIISRLNELLVPELQTQSMSTGEQDIKCELHRLPPNGFPSISGQPPIHSKHFQSSLTFNLTIKFFGLLVAPPLMSST